MVALHLKQLDLDAAEMLFPIHIEIDNTGSHYTVLHVVSENTPFFLYTLSSALCLHKISIEQVRIHTTHNKIEDDFFLSD
jgi:UTP:GlnB (protein PII) uridylyltransferase